VLTQANVHNSQELHRAHEQLLAVNLNLPSIGTADLTDINKRLAALLTLDA
jgi:hypothetical protein